MTVKIILITNIKLLLVSFLMVLVLNMLTITHYLCSAIWGLMHLPMFIQA